MFTCLSSHVRGAPPFASQQVCSTTELCACVNGFADDMILMYRQVYSSICVLCG